MRKGQRIRVKRRRIRRRYQTGFHETDSRDRRIYANETGMWPDNRSPVISVLPFARQKYNVTQYNGEAPSLPGETTRSLALSRALSRDLRRGTVGVAPARWTGSLKKCKCNRCPGERELGRRSMKRSVRLATWGADLSSGGSHQRRLPNRAHPDISCRRHRRDAFRTRAFLPRQPAIFPSRRGAIRAACRWITISPS